LRGGNRDAQRTVKLRDPDRLQVNQKSAAKYKLILAHLADDETVAEQLFQFVN